MIEAIGIKRILMIVVFAAVASIFAALNYYVFVPQTAAAKAKLAEATTQEAGLRAEIDKMRNDMAQFETQKALYAKMVKVGFFNDQDRVLARERFDVMQKMSKILAAKYEIRPAAIEASEEADSAGFGILASPISISLSAIDDVDIYRFIYYMTYGFPGHITIKNLIIERKVDVSPALLKQIGTGVPPEVIGAKMDLEWRTMARKEAILPTTLQPVSPDGAVEGIVQ